MRSDHPVAEYPPRVRDEVIVIGATICGRPIN
jgi:hypothetical protein